MKKFSIGRGGIIVVLLTALTMLTSCSREMDHTYALEQLTAQTEFTNPYYAPFRIGEVVLTGENFKNSDAYIRENYGALIDAGLVTVEYADNNSWRSVIDVKLTPQGTAMSDPRRSDDREAYVHVCTMVPTTVKELRTLAEKQVIECTYTFEQRELTPFGIHRGFAEGQSYQDKRLFVYSRGKWRLN